LRCDVCGGGVDNGAGVKKDPVLTVTKKKKDGCELERHVLLRTENEKVGEEKFPQSDKNSPKLPGNNRGNNPRKEVSKF